MRLPHQDRRIIGDPAAKNLAASLESIRLALNLNAQDWCELLQLSNREYQRITDLRKQIPGSRLVTLAHSLDLSIESLLTGRIDYRALSAHLSGDTTFIPEKYLTAAFSKRRTLSNILRYVDTTLGGHVSLNVLRTLQVTPSALRATEEDINIQFATDVLTELKRRNLPASYFERLGMNSIVQTQNSTFGRALSECRTTLELYRTFCEEKISYHEKNGTYEVIKGPDQSLVVEFISNPEVNEILKMKYFGSQEICDFKTGVISKIPHYIGKAGAATQKTHCVHWGHQTCRWTVKNPTRKPLTNETMKN